MKEKTTFSALGRTFPHWEGTLAHPLYSKVFKRVLDLIGALILLIPALIIMLPIAAIIKCSSKGSILYRAPRGGYRNKPFWILKFRTMVVGADRFSGTTALADPRTTKIGRVLRYTKLDELPQIFNILMGDMSFIGPRPELLRYTTRYTPQQECILWVRPGISDPASIELINLDELVGSRDPQGNYEKLILERKNNMRVQYATTQSFGRDFRIFIQTIHSVLSKIFSMLH
ncbi:MAG: sugar transferase [Clostridiales bacterium]|nr:sugar transferase [Clostridiales bacterium]